MQIDDNFKSFVKREFKRLEEPVTIILFTKNGNEIRSILSQIIGLTLENMISMTECEPNLTGSDIQENNKSKIDKVPVIMLHSSKKYNIRFFGTLTGIELENFVSTIVDVSRNQTGLPKFLEEKIQEIDEPVHLEVFVTPSCPYCPMQVRLAHSFAITNKLITADMVLSTEFPEESARNKVFSVPKTVINKNVDSAIDGAVGASKLLAEIVKCLEKKR